MSVSSYQELRGHIGHRIVCTYYGEESDPVNIAVECEDCGSVIIDFDREGYTKEEYEVNTDHIDQAEKYYADNGTINQGGAP